MFLGAVFTSLQIFIGLNFALLAVGNGAWAIILIKIREWAAASVFIVMAMTWTIGLIKWIMI